MTDTPIQPAARDAVVVEQCDREAAAKTAHRIIVLLGGGLDGSFPARAREGVWDNHWLVQDAARHRQLGEERGRGETIVCAGCEGRPAPENNPCAICGATPPAASEPGDRAGKYADLIARLRDRAYALPAELAADENEASGHCGERGTDTAEDYLDAPDVLLLHDAADALAALPSTPPAAVSLIDAFEMGYSFAFDVTCPQSREDSRAIGRLLGSTVFDPIKDRIDEEIKSRGFNSFQTADEGICAAKRIIHAAFATPPAADAGDARLREALRRIAGFSFARGNTVSECGEIAAAALRGHGEAGK